MEVMTVIRLKLSIPEVYLMDRYCLLTPDKARDAIELNLLLEWLEGKKLPLERIIIIERKDCGVLLVNGLGVEKYQSRWDMVTELWLVIRTDKNHTDNPSKEVRTGFGLLDQETQKNAANIRKIKGLGECVIL